MFDPTQSARIFGVAPGADFPAVLVAGILHRTKDLPPENLARVELFVNTRRMQRRVLDLFANGTAKLLPKIRLITEFSGRFEKGFSTPPVSTLRRRFELIDLINALLDQQPELAPKSALFDLADSLALLLDEMNDEGVSAADIAAMDVTDHSGHWERSQRFLEIIGNFDLKNTQSAPDATSRQQAVIGAMIKRWQSEPPTHPIIIAGSTGSRGSTSSLMAAVSRLPQGALVLPGFDFDLPETVWENLVDSKVSEVHPQFRLAKIVESSGRKCAEILAWHETVNPPVPARNALISLAMRPAPVTSQWMQEGPKLKEIDLATEKMSLIEAPSERIEAMAIAMILRQAAQNNQTAALVTPDKILSRRVQTALDRWRIEPDISAGEPLDNSAPGRLFRHVADMFGVPLNAENLLVVLKHPLVTAANTDRGQHLKWTRELELFLLQEGPSFQSRAKIEDWAGSKNPDEGRAAWAKWILDVLAPLPDISQQPMSDHLEIHSSITKALVNSPDADGPDRLWDGPAGAEMKAVILNLTTEAPVVGNITTRDYGSLFLSVLRRSEVRDPIRPHPNIMIWGTLEARVQGADLVILGGLNEGTWPRAPSPDPWLNRDMRHSVGLLLPERQIGLAAHDFQQAVAAKHVILSRSVRTDEAPSVPSRWLSRITNLMDGISNESAGALCQMRHRGNAWLQLVETLETPTPVDPEPRPAPAPPVHTRPDSLSVTEITRLIRDPYAIYAQKVLNLYPLEPLDGLPDARLRGILLHKVMEDFIGDDSVEYTKETAYSRLLDTVGLVFSESVPWPATRVLWESRLERIAESLLKDEIFRRSRGRFVLLEETGSHRFADMDIRLTAIADRIDKTPDGQFIIYDYKTGKIPTAPEMEHFEKQLYLEAMLLEQGAFKGIHGAVVTEVAHIGLGSDAVFKRVQLDPDKVKSIKGEFLTLIGHFKKAQQGYSSRRAVANLRFAGDYDHLARFGEWDDSDDPQLIEVGQ